MIAPGHAEREVRIDRGEIGDHVRALHRELGEVHGAAAAEADHDIGLRRLGGCEQRGAVGGIRLGTDAVEDDGLAGQLERRAARRVEAVGTTSALRSPRWATQSPTRAATPDPNRICAGRGRSIGCDREAVMAKSWC